MLKWFKSKKNKNDTDQLILSHTIEHIHDKKIVGGIDCKIVSVAISNNGNIAEEQVKYLGKYLCDKYVKQFKAKQKCYVTIFIYASKDHYMDGRANKFADYNYKNGKENFVMIPEGLKFLNQEDSSVNGLSLIQRREIFSSLSQIRRSVGKIVNEEIPVILNSKVSEAFTNRYEELLNKKKATLIKKFNINEDTLEAIGYEAFNYWWVGQG